MYYGVINQNEMHTINLNMLCSFMKDRCSSNMNCSLTLTMKWNRTWNRNKKVLKKTMQPFQLTESDCHRSVFNFSRRRRKCVLLLNFSRQRRTFKRSKITGNRPVSKKATGPIRIIVSKARLESVEEECFNQECL